MRGLLSIKLVRIFFAMLVFLVLIFFNPYSLFNPFRSISAVIFLPFQKVFYTFSAAIYGTVDFIDSIGQLKNENAKLLIENRQLLAENAKLFDEKNENVVLREQLKLLPRDKYDLIAAEIVSQDPHGMGNWIEIDRGSDDGIVVGMPVIVSKGILVGKIQEVNAGNSRIMLVTNSKSTINVMTLQNSTKGVIKGEYGLGIIFDMILQTDTVSIADDVVTSGIGGEMPRGLYVGSVREVHASNDQLFQQAIVSSPLLISKLQKVFVIKQSK